MKKRVLALLMVLALLVACVPGGVLAEGTESDIVIENGEQAIEQSAEETTQEAVEPLAEEPPAPHSHSAEQHDCEHCDETVTWTAWGDDETEKSTMPTTKGHYYLVGDVTVTAQQRVTGTNDVVLCLNGWNADGNKSACIYRVQDTAKLTVSDCTSYTDAEGNLVAGSLRNGKNTDVGGAVYAMTNAVINLSDIKITGHENTQSASNAGWSGGAMQIRNNAVATLKNVELSGNKTSADGGAICLRNSARLILENCLFKDNEAATSGGAIYMAAGTTKLTATGCTFENNKAVSTNGGAVCTIAEATDITLTDCIFTENEAGNRGGAIYVDNSTITVTGGEMTGNTAKGGGAVHAYKGNTTLDGVTITDNKATGSGGSAVYVNGGSAKLRIEDCTITGNQSTGTGTGNRGGVYMTNNSDKLTVSGATVVDDNMVGVDGSTAKEVNILLQNNGASMNVDGLADGAKISVLTHAGEVETPSFLVDTTDPAAWDKAWVTYENNGMAVDYDKEKDEFFFVDLTPVSTHVHCACGEHLAADESCEHAENPGCDHTEITYEPWESTNSLPNSSGNYYLTGDVVVTKETPISTNGGVPDIINLCLNGYTITVDHETEGKINDQIFYMTITADLTISDCTAHIDEEGNYAAGKLTGGTYSVITAGITGKNQPDVTLNLYDGIITGNSAAGNGGAINLTTGTSTFNMYGGLITGNSATGNGGAVYVGEGNTFHMYGGEISGNTASGSGGVYIHAAAAAVSIEGDSIITDNVAGAAASNLYLGGEVTATIGTMGEKANVGISGDLGKLPRQVSANEASLTGLVGDSQYRPLELIDGYVYISFTKDHAHCDCGGGDVGCDHTETPWVAWDNAAGLPTGDGYYYLVTDVTLSATAPQSTGDLHLCLNGHTVTANGDEGTNRDRAYSVSGDATLTISDCTASYAEDGTYTAGKLTGGSYGVVFVPNQSGQNEDGTNKENACTVNLYDGILTGSCIEGFGGAVSVQDGATFNMYGGEISGNTAKIATAADGTTSGGHGGALYVGTNGTFNMYGGTITGNTAEDTGTVYVQNSAFNLSGGKITGNTVAKNAGGVIVTGSTTVMTMTGGEISGNTAGGAAGGVLIQNRATLDMQGGVISGNTATGADGGGVYVSTNSFMTMSGGEISGNTSKTYGGGVNVYGATFTMTGGTISGNTSVNGAGIAARLGSRTVDGKTVRDVPATVTVQSGAITGNTATSTGGGAFLNGNGVVMNVEGGEISKNTAPHGGGVITQTVSVLNLTGGKITGNTAPKGGGGVYVSYTSTMNMEGGEISGNKTDANGGGMYVLGAEVALKGGKISGNYAKGSAGAIYATHYKKKATETTEAKTYTARIDLAGVTVSGNSTAGNGGGIVTSNSTEVNLTSGSISSNTAAKAAGGILLQSRSVLNFKGGSVSYNSAKNGGGVYISTNSFIYMYGGSVSNNTATGSCGGMYLLRCEATLAGGSVSNNTTKVNGGGLYISGAKVKLAGTNIRDNVAEGNGGGICTTRAKATSNGVTTEYYTDLTMTGGTISGNSTVNGGGILLQAQSTMTLKDGVIENNKTTKSGAGIYVSSTCTFNMEGGTVQNNEAETSGAGIYHYKSTGTYTGGLIKGNKAGSNAGGMMTTGEGYTVTIKDLTITENTATSGGGMVVQGKVTVNIEGGEFTKNTAENNGGGVYVSTNSFLNVSGGNFAENTSGLKGGAIYFAVTSTGNVTGGTYTENTANEGGGIYSYTDLYISNVQITNNTAVTTGGGLCTGKMGARGFFQPDGLVANGLTITGNTAGGQGGGVYLSVGHTSSLKNSVIRNNTAAAEGGGIWAASDTEMVDLTVTGNTSGGAGYAVYLENAEYDGESYVKGVFKIGGVMTVDGNEGGDMYIGQQTTVSIGAEGLTGDSKLNIQLHSGLLTQTLYGEYDYEGGNQAYVVTAGSRSVTDPEYDAAWNDQFKTEEPTGESTETPTGEDGGEKTDTNPVVWIVAAGGVVVVAAIAAIIAIISKKKAAAKK